MILATYQAVNAHYLAPTDPNLKEFLGFDPLWAFPANNVEQFWINNLLFDAQLPEVLTVFNPEVVFAINRIQWRQYLKGEIPFSEVYITNDPQVVYLANQTQSFLMLVPQIDHEIYSVNLYGFSKEYEKQLEGRDRDYFDSMIENAVLTGRAQAEVAGEADPNRYIAHRLAIFYRNTYLSQGEAVNQYSQIVGYLGEVQFVPKAVNYVKRFFEHTYSAFADQPSRETLTQVIDQIKEETLVYP